MPPTEQRSRYTLTRLHAEGGLGKIWLARDHDLNREVAMKEIKPERANHPEACRRFLKEAQVTGQLEHPNIVPVYELSRRPEDDQPFYTMRLVRGQTLRRSIADYHQQRRNEGTDPLAFRKLLGVLVSVCQAIHYAHGRGVIHRDLKPDNVMLGSFGEVILLDWGLAKMIDEPESESMADRSVIQVSAEALTPPTFNRVGTPAYMAPEQVEARNDQIDVRTDIYGLGAILFEILTGRPPHEGKDAAELYHQIVSGATPRAREVEPTAPRPLEAVCLKAMAKTRLERYGRAVDLAEDIQRWIADEPISGYIDPLSVRLAR
jgi:serine/threonine protein kinase